MTIPSSEEFKELDRLLDYNSYGPRGFIDAPHSIARKTGKLKTGLENSPPSSPGRICTYAYVICERTVLMPLDTGFPECSIFTRDTQLPRLVCIADPGQCTVGQNCMSILLNRLGGLANYYSKWELFILYWRFKSRLMGLVVRSSDSKMRLIVINPHSLDYFITRSAEKFVVRF